VEIIVITVPLCIALCIGLCPSVFCLYLTQSPKKIAGYSSCNLSIVMNYLPCYFEVRWSNHLTDTSIWYRYQPILLMSVCCWYHRYHHLYRHRYASACHCCAINQEPCVLYTRYTDKSCDVIDAYLLSIILFRDARLCTTGCSHARPHLS